MTDSEVILVEISLEIWLGRPDELAISSSKRSIMSSHAFRQQTA